MNRRVMALTLALVAGAGLLAWVLRTHLREAQQHQREVLARAAQKKKLLAPAAIDAPRPVTPAEYFDVAAHMLFSKDRNPTEIVEVKPPPPKPPLPPLPAYYGQVSLGDPAIFLSTNGGVQKTYHTGEQVGDKDKYTILGFDQEKIKLGFNDETVEKKLDDLRPKEPERSRGQSFEGMATGGRPPTMLQGGNAGGNTQSLSPASNSSSLTDDAAKKDEVVGAPYGGGFYACVAGDSTPDGGVKDGKRKVISHTLFGQTCHWETVK